MFETQATQTDTYPSESNEFLLNSHWSNVFCRVQTKDNNCDGVTSPQKRPLLRIFICLYGSNPIKTYCFSFLVVMQDILYK